MMSQRAQQYLNNLQRIDDWVVNSDELIDYVNRQKYLLSQELIRVQLVYSGYRLTIKGRPGAAFILNFISKQDVSCNTEIFFYEIGNNYLLEFGDHASAQLNYYITGYGQICTWGHEEGAVPNIICSSVEKFIEQYALQDELATQIEHPGYYRVFNLKQLDELLQCEFDEISACSDNYSYWGSNNFLTVVRGTWLHEPKSYLHVYGKNLEECAKFIERLELAKLIE